MKAGDSILSSGMYFSLSCETKIEQTSGGNSDKAVYRKDHRCYHGLAFGSAG
jgi:hypothetical protein